MRLHKLKTYDDPVLDRQLEELFRMIAPVLASGSPAGVLEPRYVGDEYLDTTGNVWYKANGLTSADWVTYAILGAHTHTGDDVVYTDTITAAQRKIIIEDAILNTEEL